MLDPYLRVVLQVEPSILVQMNQDVFEQTHDQLYHSMASVKSLTIQRDHLKHPIETINLILVRNPFHQFDHPFPAYHSDFS